MKNFYKGIWKGNGLNKNVIVSIFIISAILLTVVAFQIKISSNEREPLVEVYVNGEALYKQEVDSALSLNPNTPRSEIVENSINDILMLQYAKASGFTVSTEEVDQVLLEFQEHFPEVFERAHNGYGEEMLRQGTENRLLLQYALQEIVDNSSNAIDLSSANINKVLLENGIDPGTLSEEEYNDIVNNYIRLRQNEIKNDWLANARTNAEVEYHN